MCLLLFLTMGDGENIWFMKSPEVCRTADHSTAESSQIRIWKVLEPKER